MSLSVGRETNREFYAPVNVHDFHKKKYFYKNFIVLELER